MRATDTPYARLAGGPVSASPKLYRRRFYVLVVFCSLMFLYGTSHPLLEEGTLSAHPTSHTPYPPYNHAPLVARRRPPTSVHAATRGVVGPI